MSYLIPKTRVPPLTTAVGFNAQHAPMGAFMSFTCGHFGTRGGIGVEIGQPAGQDLFVGLKDGGRFDRAPLRCLPFFADAAGEQTHGGEFLVEQAGPAEQHATPDLTSFTEDQISRHYGWASDTWRAGSLGFTIYSPFGQILDPAGASPAALRDTLSPSVTAELSIDNRNGERTKTGVFALRFPGGGVRTLRLGGGERPRWAFVERGRLGFAATSAGGGRLVPFQRWDASAGLRDPNPVHQLGGCAGVCVEVPAGEVAVVRLALGCYAPASSRPASRPATSTRDASRRWPTCSATPSTASTAAPPAPTHSTRNCSAADLAPTSSSSSPTRPAATTAAPNFWRPPASRFGL